MLRIYLRLAAMLLSLAVSSTRVNRHAPTRLTAELCITLLPTHPCSSHRRRFDAAECGTNVLVREDARVRAVAGAGAGVLNAGSFDLPTDAACTDEHASSSDSLSAPADGGSSNSVPRISSARFPPNLNLREWG